MPLQEFDAASHADVDLRHGKGGILGGDEDVAAQGEGEAGADRRAVDGGDDRLRALHHGVEELAHDAVEPAMVAGLVLDRRPLLDVGASAEDAARGGQDDATDIGSVVQRVEDVDHLEPHGAAQRVDRRPVHGDGCDTVSDVEFQMLQLHGCSLKLRSPGLARSR